MAALRQTTPDSQTSFLAYLFNMLPKGNRKVDFLYFCSLPPPLQLIETQVSHIQKSKKGRKNLAFMLQVQIYDIR